jgi:hypothetical protein
VTRTKLKLDPTIPRVLLIAILLFGEAIAINAYSIMEQGRWPTALEFGTFLVGAFIQLATFLLTFLETGQTPPAPSPPAPQPS